MSQFNIFLFLFTVALIPTSLIALVMHTGRHRYSRMFFTVMGISVQLLLSVPAGLAQGFYYITKIEDKPFMLRMLVPFLSSAFNMGGRTVRTAFDLLSGGNLTGSDKIPLGILHFQYWFPFIVLQTVVLGYLFALRFEKKRSWTDPYILAGAFLFLANSVINASWAWWSTI